MQAKIEYSLSTVMSLVALSSARSTDEEENEFNEENENSALEMSDDDFKKLSEDDFVVEDESEDEGNNESEEDGSGDNSEEEDEDSLGDDNTDENNDDDPNEEDEDGNAEPDDSEQADNGDDNSEDQPNNEDNPKLSKYEEAYNELFGKPIHASGREVNLRDVNQAKNLIEMGVDYNKKMQHMRPHMQTLKTLEKEGLLGDQEQLNLLLEAKQGNKDAIKKLIAQADIDILDIADDDENDASSYTPDNHMVSAKEIEIEEAFSAIRGSGSYEKTVDVMTNILDEKSREIITDNPQYITALNKDVESGLYDKVMDMVQYQKDTRAVPQGMSDIEIYIATVTQLAQQEQNGGNMNQGNQQQGAGDNNSTGKQTGNSNGASAKKKKAMSSSRSRTKKESKFDPMKSLNMSDEEFMKKFGTTLQ